MDRGSERKVPHIGTETRSKLLRAHDRDIAQLADRIVHIEDGKIVGDTRKGSDFYA